MNVKRTLSAGIASLVLCATSATSSAALLIAEWDYVNANNASTLINSMAASGVTASSLSVNGIAGTGGFANHFYHSGWGAAFDATKYYEASISTAGQDLHSMEWSLENTSTTSTYVLRTSADAFASDFATGAFFNGDVTDFSVSLASLAASSLTLRWYMIGSGTMGFANHNSPGAGFGLPDAGLDLRIFAVPEPSTLALMGLSLAAFGFRRRSA